MSLYDRAIVIPGRSMTRSKAPDRLRRAWAQGGQGAVIWDTEGREYLDMVCGLGAISLGYRSGNVRRQSGVYSLPHALEVEAAEAVLTHVAPWASSVRFVKTGSEATHAAYRVAKAATGRKHVVVQKHSYHGWHEWCDAMDREFIPDVKDIAAVFVEPPRFKAVDVDWLRDTRRWCDEWGSLLVFDEMIWGGRFALGGVSEYCGVLPDLACYGKAFANGEAAAFVCGGEALGEHGELVSGTFSGDTTGLQAVADTLHVYTAHPVIATLWDRARQLYDCWQQEVPASFCTLSQAAPLMGLTFTNPEHKVPFKDAMAERGILMWPDWLMTMYAHTPAHMERVAKTAGEVARGL